MNRVYFVLFVAAFALWVAYGTLGAFEQVKRYNVYQTSVRS